MTPTTKRGASALADKTEDRIPSLAADLASLSPVVGGRHERHWLPLESSPCLHSFNSFCIESRTCDGKQPRRLCGIADPLAASALVNALDDRDGDVRWLAAEGLAALGREGLQPLLAALLQRAESCWFCEGAHHVCHTLVKRRKLAPILRPVLAALKESEPGVAAPPAAYTALSRLRELS